jgi:hypothetical protein
MPDLDQIAATARQHIDTRGGSAAAGLSTEARHAIDRLRDRLAEQFGQPLADWTVTRWIVTLWVPVTLSRHATCRYSWMSPPRRSRRRCRMLVLVGVGTVRPAGGC